jgi:formylglycine-generating enzyme required for sulfatase activity
MYCPPGTFTMGAAAGESCFEKDQAPKHPVTLSRGFWLARTEVTQADWKRWMKANPSKFKGEDRPVDSVSWDAAQKFLARLNGKAGTALYRLPTEAEWEYACLAGQPAPAPADMPTVAWFNKSPLAGTSPVAKLKPNAWGLYDMLGNVREWCSDWRGPYAADPATDPQGGPKEKYRINRGGSYYCHGGAMSPAYRWYYIPNFSDDDVGFRVLRITN